jgi:hypothetical protein
MLNADTEELTRGIRVTYKLGTCYTIFLVASWILLLQLLHLDSWH